MRFLLRELGHLRWLRYGLRFRIISFFQSSDSIEEKPFKVNFFGKKYTGNLSNLIDWLVFFFGGYALGELECMEDFLAGRSNSVVVDVGANVGHHTLFASTVANHVHAFEPYSKVGIQLEEKVAVNNLVNVTLHKYGLGNINGSLDFYPPDTANWGTGSFLYSSDWGNSSNSVKLNIVRGDDYFSSAGISRIDYIKIDVEQFEVHTLLGIRESLHKFRPVCFIEWNQDGKNDCLKNGINLFPENYLFFKFIGPEPFCLLFSKKGYDLQLLKDSWTNGNMLAIPEEIAKSITLKNCRSKLLEEA